MSEQKILRENNFIIKNAEFEDLAKILEIQYRAFLVEAQIVSDMTIAPMTETLENVQNDFQTFTILKACRENGEILGSIRGIRENGVTSIARLTVDPQVQGQGLGGLLLRAIEKALPSSIYTLFTRHGNSKTVQLYLRNGYTIFKVEKQQNIEFAFLEKRFYLS
ncbi:MAG: GNAT family N-acetyltransferase [Deltaproteobacteria bacterium]|nr:GNAT family N-acetyltransferase [Deltaproteobacteria bacterium]